MTWEPEPPSYRSPASGGRPRSDVEVPAKRSHLIGGYKFQREKAKQPDSGVGTLPLGYALLTNTKIEGRSAPCWWYRSN